jgi:hypothetical protein
MCLTKGFSMAANPRPRRRETLGSGPTASTSTPAPVADCPLESNTRQYAVAPGRNDSAANAPEVASADEDGTAHHEAIAKAAYFLAQARGFEPGHELDDWLLAEQQLRDGRRTPELP